MLKKTQKNLLVKSKPRTATAAFGTAMVLAVTLITTVWGKEEPTTDTSPAAKVTTDRSFVVSPILNDLPKDYSDINAIKRYSPTPPPQSNDELNVVMQQLDDLSNKYSLLKMQLATKDRREPEKPASDPRDEKAKISDLFFNGLGAEVNPLSSKERLDLLDDANKKLKLLDNPNDIYNPHAVIPLVSQYQIIAGTIIAATLVTAIDSTLPGQVIAHIRQNIYDTVTGKHLLIPRGSKAVGEYKRVNEAGQSRVSVEFARIIRPDGSSVQLEKDKFAATDLQGYAGLEGDVDNHWGQIIGTSILSALINYGAGTASDNLGNKNQNYQGSRQSSILNASQGITNVTNNLANRAINMPPTIKVPAGHLFNITVKKDLLLTLYNPMF